MAMPGGADDPAENVQRFNALLADTVTQLRHEHEALDAHGQTLDHLADSGGQELDGLNHELEARLGSIGAAETDALQSLGHTAAAAAAACDARLHDAQTGIEQLADGVGHGLADSANEVQHAAADLVASGFDPADAALTDLGHQAAERRSELEHAFDDLGSGLETAQQEAASSGSQLAGALGDFGSEADGQRGEASHVGELASYAAQGYVAELQNATTEFEHGVDEAYTAFAGALEQADTHAVSEISGLLQDAGRHLHDAALKDVEDALEHTAGESTEPLVTELSHADEVLSSGAEVAQTAAALVPDLVVSKAIVGDIAKMLESMEA
jgi:uncharacterized phage infection (PIP) family protein YhgE